MNVTERILKTVAGSLNNSIPTINVPTAPIPVQTAYAVPIGIDFCASQRNRPLALIDITAKSIQAVLWVVFCENFSPKGHPISHKPAIIKYIQAIITPFGSTVDNRTAMGTRTRLFIRATAELVYRV